MLLSSEAARVALSGAPPGPASFTAAKGIASREPCAVVGLDDRRDHPASRNDGEVPDGADGVAVGTGELLAEQVADQHLVAGLPRGVLRGRGEARRVADRLAGAVLPGGRRFGEQREGEDVDQAALHLAVSIGLRRVNRQAARTLRPRRLRTAPKRERPVRVGQSRSIASAMPWPPPMHMVISPRRPPVRSSS
jgi:hypothetical protein